MGGSIKKEGSDAKRRPEQKVLSIHILWEVNEKSLLGAIM